MAPSYSATAASASAKAASATAGGRTGLTRPSSQPSSCGVSPPPGYRDTPGEVDVRARGFSQAGDDLLPAPAPRVAKRHRPRAPVRRPVGQTGAVNLPRHVEVGRVEPRRIELDNVAMVGRRAEDDFVVIWAKANRSADARDAPQCGLVPIAVPVCDRHGLVERLDQLRSAQGQHHKAAGQHDQGHQSGSHSARPPRPEQSPETSRYRGPV
jgi:hypothetical protein